MNIKSEDIHNAVTKHLADAQKFLCDVVAIPSLSGQEADAMNLVAERFAKIAAIERVAMSNSLRDDKDYSDPVPGIEYDGRFNVRADLKGSGGGKTLLLNTHIDTVPPSPNQDRPFDPQVKDGCVFGRGACDAKGQAATVYLVMAALKELGVPMKGNLVAHLVTEEENGGNGTLAMVRHGEQADGCIVLEPTELRILSSVRGAVWFRVTLRGKAGHSGRASDTRSAVKMAIRVVEILEAYHAKLLASSRGDALFDKFSNPMPLTIGKFQAGNWPASAPAEATLEGVLGLLPNITAKQVMEQMTAAIKDEGGRDIAENFTIHFMYRHDSSVCPTDHPLVQTLQQAARSAGAKGEIDAMTASCDSWLYNNQLNIPTAVFGGGSLGVAHAANENMPVAELATAAEAIVAAALAWCE